MNTNTKTTETNDRKPILSTLWDICKVQLTYLDLAMMIFPSRLWHTALFTFDCWANLSKPTATAGEPREPQQRRCDANDQRGHDESRWSHDL